MLNNLEESLKLARKICREEDILYPHLYDRIYSFTTENIAGYIKYFDLKDKSLLTVGSSCDQVLNAILFGCKDITVLDINKFVKYYYYLKVAAILNLDKDTFMKFLGNNGNNKDEYMKDIFAKIKNTLIMLDEESYIFWQTLINEYSPKIIGKYLFIRREYSHKYNTVYHANNYIQEYDKIRKLLDDVEPKFINDEIANAKGNYDNIWLANIPALFGDQKQVPMLVDKMKELLNDKGRLLISYLYSTHEPYEDKYAKIYDIPYMLEMFKDSYCPSFSSMRGLDCLNIGEEDNIKEKDSVLILKKN